MLALSILTRAAGETQALSSIRGKPTTREDAKLENDTLSGRPRPSDTLLPSPGTVPPPSSLRVNSMTRRVSQKLTRFGDRLPQHRFQTEPRTSRRFTEYFFKRPCGYTVSDDERLLPAAT